MSIVSMYAVILLVSIISCVNSHYYDCESIYENTLNNWNLTTFLNMVTNKNDPIVQLLVSNIAENITHLNKVDYYDQNKNQLSLTVTNNQYLQSSNLIFNLNNHCQVYSIESNVKSIKAATVTKAPTSVPTKIPTAVPTRIPTTFPTSVPTKIPTTVPTKLPTHVPSGIPTKNPTQVPTKFPTNLPTKNPTKVPTGNPTKMPTNSPTKFPTNSPTKMPTPPTYSPTSSKYPVQNNSQHGITWFDYDQINMNNTCSDTGNVHFIITPKSQVGIFSYYCSSNNATYMHYLYVNNYTYIKNYKNVMVMHMEYSPFNTSEIFVLWYNITNQTFYHQFLYENFSTTATNTTSLSFHMAPIIGNNSYLSIKYQTSVTFIDSTKYIFVYRNKSNHVYYSLINITGSIIINSQNINVTSYGTIKSCSYYNYWYSPYDASIVSEHSLILTSHNTNNVQIKLTLINNTNGSIIQTMDATGFNVGDYNNTNYSLLHCSSLPFYDQYVACLNVEDDNLANINCHIFSLEGNSIFTDFNVSYPLYAFHSNDLLAMNDEYMINYYYDYIGNNNNLGLNIENLFHPNDASSFIDIDHHVLNEGYGQHYLLRQTNYTNFINVYKKNSTQYQVHYWKTSFAFEELTTPPPNYTPYNFSCADETCSLKCGSIYGDCTGNFPISCPENYSNCDIQCLSDHACSNFWIWGASMVNISCNSSMSCSDATFYIAYVWQELNIYCGSNSSCQNSIINVVNSSSATIECANKISASNSSCNNLIMEVNNVDKFEIACSDSCNSIEIEAVSVGELIIEDDDYGCQNISLTLSANNVTRMDYCTGYFAALLSLDKSIEQMPYQNESINKYLFFILALVSLISGFFICKYVVYYIHYIYKIIDSKIGHVGYQRIPEYKEEEIY